MNDELPSKIESWLLQEGYPLEMRTAAEFLEQEFSVRQGDYYIDPETSASREIDVVAEHTELDPHWATTYFVGECKGSRDAPWVLFTSGRMDVVPKFRLSATCASSTARRGMAQLQKRELGAFPILSRKMVRGYALRQALKAKKDQTYEALMTVTKAAMFHVLDGDKVSPEVPRRAICAFPFIVTAAPLFSCALTKDARFELQEIDRGTIAWRDRSAGRSLTYVDCSVSA